MKTFEGNKTCSVDLFKDRHQPFHANLFQDFIISENFLRSLSLLKSLESGQLVLSERSLLSNAHIFVKQIKDKGLVSEMEGLFLLKKSCDYFNHLVSNFNLKPTFIFLYDAIHPTWLRMRERAREGEEKLCHQDLGELFDRYYAYFRSPFFPYRVIFVNLRNFALGVDAMADRTGLAEYIDINSVITFLDHEIYGGS